MCVHTSCIGIGAGGGERGGRGVQAGLVPVGEARVADDCRAPRLLPAARGRGAREAALPASHGHRHQGLPLRGPHAVPGAAGAATARGMPFHAIPFHSVPFHTTLIPPYDFLPAYYPYCNRHRMHEITSFPYVALTYTYEYEYRIGEYCSEPH